MAAGATGGDTEGGTEGAAVGLAVGVAGELGANAAGGAAAGAGCAPLTVMMRALAVPVPPLASVTVSLALKVPAAA